MIALSSIATQLLGKDSPYSWRSLFGFLLVVTLATGLLVHGHLSGDQWVSMVQFVAPAFMAGEALRKFAGAGPERGAE